MARFSHDMVIQQTKKQEVVMFSYSQTKRDWDEFDRLFDAAFMSWKRYDDYTVQEDKESGCTVLEVALPGFAKDDVEVTVSGREIVIAPTEACKRTLPKSRFLAGKQLDMDMLRAELSNGLLRIEVPNRLSLSPRKIELQ